jgi:RecG-like helicase
MTNWARDWQNSDASKFLTAEQVARLKKFESDAEAEGLRSDLGTYGDTAFFEKRRQDFVDRQRARRAREDQAAEDDPERLPLNLTAKQTELIREIQADDDLDEAEKARLIAEIISGART